jgi:hypothetical protein
MLEKTPRPLNLFVSYYLSILLDVLHEKFRLTWIFHEPERCRNKAFQPEDVVSSTSRVE